MAFHSANSFLSVFLLLASSYESGLTQDSAALPVMTEVPEKVMAAHLIQAIPAKLPDGVLHVKCSNALVMLDVTVDERGSVSSAKSVSGYEELKEPATAAVKQWTYKPYSQNGAATAVKTHVSIFFLGDGESFPMYSPDGSGGVKGGNMLPLPPGCGSGPSVKRAQ